MTASYRRVWMPGCCASCRAVALAVLGAWLTWTVPAASEAEAEKPMALGVQTHFSQGWRLPVLDLASEVGPILFRDGISWSQVEIEPGRYAFDLPSTSYPFDLRDAGREVSLTFAGTNPLYDAGGTPYTPEALEAHAAFVEATLDEFPFVDVIEIGNEFNSQPGVAGHVAEAPYDQRPAFYVELLQAVDERISKSHPDVRILGGATHSVPVGYLAELFELGAADHMDGLALHPYGLWPEEVPEILDALRRQMPDPGLPLHVTEFGTTDPERAAEYLGKMVTLMAANGVERAIWYALLRQSHSPVVPLLELDGTVTTAGKAFRFFNDTVLPNPVRDVSDDPFTYAFQAGERVLVVWGEPRALRITRPDVSAFSATGAPLDPVEAIDPEAPIVLTSPEPLSPGNGVEFGPQPLLADSFHQFDLVRGTDNRGETDPFERFALSNGEKADLEMLGGGETTGVLWNPRLGHPYLNPTRISANTLNPGMFVRPDGGATRVEMVHRYTAESDMAVNLKAEWQPAENTEDGITVTVSHNGETLLTTTSTERIDLDLPGLGLRAGDRLQFTVGPNGSPTGDTTRYRIQLARAEPERAP